MRHDLVAIKAPPAPPAHLLYREISSCALDAELARVTGTWDLELQAQDAARRMPERVTNQPVSKKFRHVRRGGRFKPAHLARLIEAFPKSRLLACQEHRIARVLCDPTVSHDQLVNWMYELPRGQVRCTVLLDCLTFYSGYRTTSRTAWTRQAISRLVEIGTPASLFALVCRTRIAQLEGEVDLCEVEASAIWRALPRACGKCMALLLGSHALTRAIDYFLSWEPFSEMRDGSPRLEAGPDARLEALAQLEFVRQRAIRTGRIPASIMDIRAARAADVYAPVQQGFFERYGLR